MMRPAVLQVCGVTQGGGFAGEVIIKEGGVVKLPTHVDLVAAAGLPVIFGTAHLAIKERAQVKPGLLPSIAPREHSAAQQNMMMSLVVKDCPHNSTLWGSMYFVQHCAP